MKNAGNCMRNYFTGRVFVEFDDLNQIHEYTKHSVDTRGYYFSVEIILPSDLCGYYSNWVY